MILKSVQNRETRKLPKTFFLLQYCFWFQKKGKPWGLASCKYIYILYVPFHGVLDKGSAKL